MPNSEQQRHWYKWITAKADTKAPAEKRAVVHVYDTIGADMFFGGVDVKELVDEIEALGDDVTLEARINSPGGYAWDGLTLATAIMRHKGPTETYVDGLAASAASIVALASDRVVVSKYGQIMLHNARGGVYGTAEELKAGAEALGKLNNSIADFYADRAGGDAAGWRRVMSRETWYNAEEALAAGLATEVDESAKREDSEQAVALSLAKPTAMFKYPGRQAAPPPTASAQDGPTGPVTQEAKVPISEKLAERLGLSADATDEEVNAKLDELEGKGTPAEPGDAGTPPAAPPAPPAPEAGAVEKVAAEAAKLGLMVTAPEAVAKMRDDAALGVAAHAELTSRRINTALDTAIERGKILPALRGKFEALMRSDERGTTQLLDAIPEQSAAPTAELGHALDPVALAGGEDAIKNDPRYAAWKF